MLAVEPASFSFMKFGRLPTGAFVAFVFCTVSCSSSAPDAVNDLEVQSSESSSTATGEAIVAPQTSAANATTDSPTSSVSEQEPSGGSSGSTDDVSFPDCPNIEAVNQAAGTSLDNFDFFPESSQGGECLYTSDSGDVIIGVSHYSYTEAAITGFEQRLPMWDGNLREDLAERAWLSQIGAGCRLTSPTFEVAVLSGAVSINMAALCEILERATPVLTS